MNKQVIRIVESLDSIFSAINVMGSEAEQSAAVCKFFSRQHRTLQQNFMRVVIIPILRELANAQAIGHTDARNEASARQASIMVAALDKSEVHLPFI